MYLCKKQMANKITYWTELSDYDVETAEVMLKNRRYLYVGFMCHQAIEKIFKAYFVKLKNETAPYTHALSYLAKKGEFYDLFSEKQRDFIDMLEPLNIETRYPSHKERLLRSLTDAKCTEILNNTKQLQQWIKQKL
jgi:HEPN domain-containing protein